MAELNKLSSKLEVFKQVYDSSFKAMEDKKNNLCDASFGFDNIILKLDEAIDNFNTATSNDDKATLLIDCVTLARDGVTRVKSHVEGDLGNLFANGKDLRDNIIAVIERKREEGKNWQEAWYERIWNATIGSFVEEWHQNDTDKIDRANREIDQLNKKGEAQLDAMAAAMNSVKFGVVGNMVKYGTLGNSVMYNDNYKFDGAAWDKANPVYQLNIFQEVGCAVVGAVEGVVKIGEGVVDAVLTPVAGVVSLIKGDDDHFLTKFIKEDLSNDLAVGAASIIGVDKEHYNSSSGRSFGKTASSIVGHSILWATGGGAIVSALAVAGNGVESGLEQGKTVGASMLSGALSGGLSFVGGKAIGAVMSRIAPSVSSWINNGTGFVAKTLKAAGTSFSNWGSLGAGGKFVSAVASPVRGAFNLYGKVVNTGANALNKVMSSNALGRGLNALDQKTTSLVNHVFEGKGARQLRTQNNKAINEYNKSVKEWQDAGGKVNSDEYTKMKDLADKLPNDYKPTNLGDKVLSTSESDKLIKAYNDKVNSWKNASSPTSGAEYDAMNQAYQNIPDNLRPTTLGDTGYVSGAKEILAQNYNQKVDAWKNAGGHNSGAEYDAMVQAHKALPNSSNINLGDIAMTQSGADSLARQYNSKLTDWVNAGSPNSGAAYDAMNQARASIPDAIRPELGKPAFTSQSLNAAIKNYHNAVTDWYANGGNTYGADYQKMLDLFNNIPNELRTGAAGAPLDLQKISNTLTSAGNKAGALFASTVGNN